MRFALYKRDGLWGWRAFAADDKCVAESPMNFTSREDAVTSLSLFSSAIRHQEHLMVWDADRTFLTHV